MAAFPSWEKLRALVTLALAPEINWVAEGPREARAPLTICRAVDGKGRTVRVQPGADQGEIGVLVSSTACHFACPCKTESKFIRRVVRKDKRFQISRRIFSIRSYCDCFKPPYVYQHHTRRLREGSEAS